MSISLALRPGISFCHVAGRILFLDIRRDRYFCLSAEAERCFDRLVNGSALSDDARAVLARLVDGGILRPAPEGVLPQACPPASGALDSLLDGKPDAPGVAGLMAAATALASAPALLRLRGLGRLLDDIARRKARARPKKLSNETLLGVASAFERLAAIATVHDRCLVRSIAVARRLIALGGQPDLVLGVKLQPFKAHCWVEHGSWLVNDRHETVRDFTPILIV